MQRLMHRRPWVSRIAWNSARNAWPWLAECSEWKSSMDWSRKHRNWGLHGSGHNEYWMSFSRSDKRIQPMVRIVLDNDRNISYSCVGPDLSDKYYEKVHQPGEVSAVFLGQPEQETRSKVHVLSVPTWHQTKGSEWSFFKHLTTTILAPIRTPAADNDWISSTTTDRLHHPST